MCVQNVCMTVSMLVGVVNLVGMMLAVDTSLPVIGPSPVQNLWNENKSNVF